MPHAHSTVGSIYGTQTPTQIRLHHTKIGLELGIDFLSCSSVVCRAPHFCRQRSQRRRTPSCLLKFIIPVSRNWPSLMKPRQFVPMLSSLSFGLCFRMAAIALTSKLAPLSLRLVRLAKDCGESFEKQNWASLVHFED